MLISIDEELAEGRYRAEPKHDWTAERLFERRWALDLLERSCATARGGDGGGGEGGTGGRG